MAADSRWVRGVVELDEVVGHFSESQLVRGFYFYAPSCPGGAGRPSPAVHTPAWGGWEWIWSGFWVGGVVGVINVQHSGSCCGCGVEIFHQSLFLWIHTLSTWSALHCLDEPGAFVSLSPQSYSSRISILVRAGSIRAINISCCQCGDASTFYSFSHMLRMFFT